ncbi:TPA: hypothetical protein HA238_04935 [Candidatus Micrarchaeota archaeon]|nr:hypothetical protein [Candidatus Micrarchaeota archaeon]
MEETVSLAFAGLVLGITHALDADHVAAISTIVSERKRVWPSAMLGVIWGFGHTMTLLAAVLGMFIIGFKMPELVQNNAEVLVGIMLLVLGTLAIKKALGAKVHSHEHIHDGVGHIHIHQHIFEKGHEHSHEKRSLLIGIIHGFAGSAALMMIIATNANGLGDGLGYVLAFGIGTTIGMATITMLMAIPISIIAKSNRITNVQTICGAFSIVIGLFIISQMLVL